jgi:DNA mismatch repair protein MutS
MAQCGVPVPASSMILKPFTGIYTRILGNDNLWAGLSSFAVEMTEFRTILKSVNNRSLVLGDELCSGTETESAISIVSAGVHHLTSKGCKFLFATHLHELTTMEEILNLGAKVQSYHLSVHSDPERGCLIYDRLLKPGSGSSLYGLEVCKGLDMEKDFLEMAYTIRKKRAEMKGELEGEKLKGSRYNASVVVNCCQVCGEKKDLETHHIFPQSEAKKTGKKIGANRFMNDQSNLVILCEMCHNDHHKGILQIDGWVQTVEGIQLKFRPTNI